MILASSPEKATSKFQTIEQQQSTWLKQNIMWLKVALYQTILSRIRTWAEELILTTVTEWECKEHATLNQQPNSSVDKRESVVRIVSIARIVRADNHRRSKYSGRMVRVQVSYNGADSFRKVQIGPKPWLEIIQWLEIIKNFKDTEHSGNASSPFYKLLFFSIWPWPCQLSSWTQPNFCNI